MTGTSDVVDVAARDIGAASRRNIDDRSVIGVNTPEQYVHFSDITKRFLLRPSVKDILTAPFAPRATVTGLAGVSGYVRRGELFGILGLNGAGKTTLFRILSSLMLPDSGTASIGGFDVVHESDQVRRLVACVLANERAINWRLSTRENLRLFAVMHGIRANRLETDVADAMAMVELSDHADRPVGGLSSGLRQRAMIARALIVKPKVLLLDEPTRSLDPVSARALRTFVLANIVREMGCAVIVATHDGEEAFSWCDRVSVLHRGAVLATGTADSLAHRFGDAVMGIWTTTPHAEAFRIMVARGKAFEVVGAEGCDRDWCCVRVRLPNGLDAAAAIFAILQEYRVPVARFERVDNSLADLIERVIQGSIGHAGATL